MMAFGPSRSDKVAEKARYDVIVHPFSQKKSLPKKILSQKNPFPKKNPFFPKKIFFQKKY